ncbi:alpha/beta-hydrolase [Atractiella rhizophila]|nr:alpha/beta-hydrolase [Atractiella rhizophila]
MVAKIPSPDAVIPYKQSPIEMNIEVYLPKGVSGSSVGGVVWFCGGGFISGTVDDLAPVEHHFITGAGYAVLGIEYRKAPQAKLSEIIEDAVDSYNFVKSGKLNAALAGKAEIDLDKLVVSGSSAGGYLALSLLPNISAPLPRVGLIYPLSKVYSPNAGQRVSFPTNFPEPPASEIDPNGPVTCRSQGTIDFGTFTATGRKAVTMWAVQEGKSPEFLFGSGKEEQQKRAKASDTKLDDFFASSETGKIAKFGVIHGEADSMVPFSGAVELVEKALLDGKAEKAKLFNIPGVNHGFDELLLDEKEWHGEVGQRLSEAWKYILN